MDKRGFGRKEKEGRSGGGAVEPHAHVEGWSGRCVVMATGVGNRGRPRFSLTCVWV